MKLSLPVFLLLLLTPSGVFSQGISANMLNALADSTRSVATQGPQSVPIAFNNGNSFGNGQMSTSDTSNAPSRGIVFNNFNQNGNSNTGVTTPQTGSVNFNNMNQLGADNIGAFASSGGPLGKQSGTFSAMNQGGQSNIGALATNNAANGAPSGSTSIANQGGFGNIGALATNQQSNGGLSSVQNGLNQLGSNNNGVVSSAQLPSAGISKTSGFMNQFGANSGTVTGTAPVQSGSTFNPFPNVIGATVNNNLPATAKTTSPMVTTTLPPVTVPTGPTATTSPLITATLPPVTAPTVTTTLPPITVPTGATPNLPFAVPGVQLLPPSSAAINSNTNAVATSNNGAPAIANAISINNIDQSGAGNNAAINSNTGAVAVSNGGGPAIANSISINNINQVGANNVAVINSGTIVNGRTGAVLGRLGSSCGWQQPFGCPPGSFCVRDQFGFGVCQAFRCGGVSRAVCPATLTCQPSECLCGTNSGSLQQCFSNQQCGGSTNTCVVNPGDVIGVCVSPRCLIPPHIELNWQLNQCLQQCNEFNPVCGFGDAQNYASPCAAACAGQHQVYMATCA